MWILAAALAGGMALPAYADDDDEEEDEPIGEMDDVDFGSGAGGGDGASGLRG